MALIAAGKGTTNEQFGQYLAGGIACLPKADNVCSTLEALFLVLYREVAACGDETEMFMLDLMDVANGGLKLDRLAFEYVADVMEQVESRRHKCVAVADVRSLAREWANWGAYEKDWIRFLYRHGRLVLIDGDVTYAMLIVGLLMEAYPVVQHRMYDRLKFNSPALEDFDKRRPMYTVGNAIVTGENHAWLHVL